MDNKLLRAYGKIDDRFIEECLAKNEKKKLPELVVWRWVMAAVLLLLLVFSTTYQVNAKFRQWVISIVPLSSREEIQEQQAPTASNVMEASKNVIQVSAVKKIDDILEAQYVTAKKAIEPFENIYASGTGEKETYFSIQNNTCVPIHTSRSLKGTLRWKGHRGFVNANIISYQGKQYVRNLYGNLEQSEEQEQKMMPQERFWLSVDDGGDFWLTLLKESNEELYEYPLQCNSNMQDIHAAKLTDVFKNIKINGKCLRKYRVVTNWEKISDRYYCALVGNTLKTAVYYRLDVVQKKAVSLELITKQKDIHFIRILQNSIIIGTESADQEECYNYYRFDMQSGRTEELYHSIRIWTEDEEPGAGGRVAFTGGRYDLFEQNGTIFLVDELTGKKMKLEGLDAGLQPESVLINTSGDKLLLSSCFSKNGIQQIGILNVPEQKLYLFERKNLTQLEECAINWLDEDTFSIEAQQENGQETSVYQYHFKR